MSRVTLEGKVVLEVEARGVDSEFHIRDDLEVRIESNRTFLMGERGQYLREIYDTGTDLIPDEIADSDPGRRKGYHIDGGAGAREITISGEYGPSAGGQWGDGSGDPAFDATDSDDPTQAAQIFEYALSQARSDSEGQTALHWGEWTDGSHSLTEGAFERPLPVAIRNAVAERSNNNPGGVEVTIDAVVTAEFPGISEFAGDIQDNIAEIIPEW